MTSLLEQYGIHSVSELPLVTDTGHISHVNAFDRHREHEMRAAVSRILTEHGLADAVAGEQVNWQQAMTDAERLPRHHRSKLRELRDRIERDFPSLVEITVDIDGDIDYAAGQFVGFRYDGRSRAYSLSSSPNDDDLALCIRRVPGGRMTDHLLSNAQVGDDVTIRGPQGHFTLDEDSTKDLAFLATGTGVAPLRGMIRYLYQEDLAEDRDVWLFYGTAWKDDLAYREEFRQLDEEHRGFHFVPTLTRERTVTTWRGETDYVQQTFCKYLADGVDPAGLNADLRKCLREAPNTDAPATIDPDELQVYACGISLMVNTLEDVVHAVGVPESDVYSEGFG
ncbi:ferredoxin--NADP reductase [Halocalculus aciditolerans]|uniref:FAD-binding FR-type domain-containing protein n=1 Tax=Halocalculus aciditolerans TaxID=1383812 RepID=A0A830FIK9_9EURY|nr:FAD-dependent oxidoreductase [Halocalculus aciditolerans]GGL59416.1 hypothetical protein GCM10009039_17070 [Halocalculus aciditolerans]